VKLRQVSCPQVINNDVNIIQLFTSFLFSIHLAKYKYEKIKIK
jgi:hypothetical protein